MTTKIPGENNKYHVSNGSDLKPNIHYTKNIDMDEEGYLKLSPPFPSLFSSRATSIPGNLFGIFTDVMKYGGGNSNYAVITDATIFHAMDLANLGAITYSSLAPSGRSAARFVGWKNVTSGNENKAYLATASKIHSFETDNAPIPSAVWRKENEIAVEYNEVFVNRNTMVGAAGSTIYQFLITDMDVTVPPASHAGQSLTLPTYFAVMGLAYSNYRMGIATRNRQGGSAYFFTWDGATSDASQGFPVNAPMILDIVAYKNSWVLLTSEGQLLYFNGAGFDELGSLPPYYFNVNWATYQNSQDHGRTMSVDGEVIYFNLGSLLVANDDNSGLMTGFYSGVWCYDPRMGGIYHRYGLANSQIFSRPNTGIAGVFHSEDHLLQTGDRVLRNQDKMYFAIKINDDDFKLADTYDLAIAGTAVSGDVSGQMTWIQRQDWTQLGAFNTNMGAVARFNDTRAYLIQGVQAFFAGLGMNTPTMTYINSMSVMAPQFTNIGCIAYYKIKAEGYEDTWNAITVKYRKLAEEGKIIVKYKTEDSYKPFGIGQANNILPTNGNRVITWVNDTTFTTTKDIPDVAVGDEVEFFQGAGAGSTAHVVTNTYGGGVWTVVVDESIRGAESGNKSTCMFDTFKKLGVITKSNDGNLTNQTRLALAIKSKWILVKLELRGNDVAIEDMYVNNAQGNPVA